MFTADFESALCFDNAYVNSLEYISFRLTLALLHSGTTFCRVVYLHRYNVQNTVLDLMKRMNSSLRAQSKSFEIKCLCLIIVSV